MAQVLKRLPKNASEEIWVALTEYKGRELLDLRVYYRAIESDEMKPSKKGVSVPLAKAPELLAALEKINDATPMETPVASFDKSDTESVRVAFKEFKGHKLVDIRVYFRPASGDEMVPSQKGVALKYPQMLNDVKEALRGALVPPSKED